MKSSKERNKGRMREEKLVPVSKYFVDALHVCYCCPLQLSIQAPYHGPRPKAHWQSSMVAPNIPSPFNFN